MIESAFRFAFPTKVELPFIPLVSPTTSPQSAES